MKSLCAAALLLFAACAAFPQTSKLGEHCDLAVLGQTDTKGFLAFDSELRAALSRQDAALITLLVNYPLRINGDRGSWYIHDAAALQARFQEIFPPAVRAVVLGSPSQSLFCNYRGVMYGNGTVWIGSWIVEEAGSAPRSTGFLVEAINLPSRGRSAKSDAWRVEFAGRTPEHRFIIDVAAGGLSRLRLWNAGQQLLSRPEWDIRQGAKRVEGTGPCVHAIWTFLSGATKFVVDEHGCYPDSNQPPKGTTGRLDMFSNEKEVGSWWSR